MKEKGIVIGSFKKKEKKATKLIEDKHISIFQEKEVRTINQISLVDLSRASKLLG